MANLMRVLSIDGGGIRGIIPGQVMISVEQKLQKMTNNPSARIGEYFDFIAGTSTGGILTCLYLCPGVNDGKGRPRYSAQEAVNLYMEEGKDIFEVSLWERIKRMDRLLDERYPHEGLMNALEKKFGDVKLSELLRPCLITSYDIEYRRSRFFTQHNAREKSMHDYKVRDVCRATSAAPTYFEVSETRSLTDITYHLVDGGVFANNPTLCGYAEVRNKFKHTAKDMVVLSLGTGKVQKEYQYEKAKDWGLMGWASPLLDIMMSGVSETVDYQMKQLFDSIDRPDQYLRVNIELRPDHSDMDNASDENTAKLKEYGMKAAEENDEKLEEFVKLLTGKKPAVRQIKAVAASSGVVRRPPVKTK